MKAYIKKEVKKILYKKFTPCVYKIYSQKPITEKLVVFADSSAVLLPDNMMEIYDRLNALGYETRVFLKRKSSKKWYRDKLYELVNAYRFTKYYAQCRCLVLTDYYYYAYANKPRQNQQVVQLWHGCGAFKTFLRIMVPNAGSAFLTVFLFSFVWYWNDYFNSSIMMPSRRTLAVSLSMLRLSLQTLGVNYLDPFSVSARLQAGALLTVLPVLVLFLFLQKYFTESIERTGLVG